MERETGMLAGLVLCVVIFVVSICWLGAYQEAKTYNKLTGANVSTWDALWVDLRVMDAPRKPQEPRP